MLNNVKTFKKPNYMRESNSSHNSGIICTKKFKYKT